MALGVDVGVVVSMKRGKGSTAGISDDNEDGSTLGNIVGTNDGVGVGTDDGGKVCDTHRVLLGE